jgi:hypothetical protein
MDSNIRLRQIPKVVERSICQTIISEVGRAGEIDKSRTEFSGIQRNGSLTSSSNIALKRISTKIEKDIKSLICSELNWEYNRLEPMGIVRYHKGEEYKPHYDDFGPIYFYHRKYSDANKLNIAGNRVSTAIIYLNDDYTGGETEFILTGNIVIPETGKLIAWNNIDSQGRRIDNALHCGRMVEKGTKYIVSVHLREGEYPE